MVSYLSEDMEEIGLFSEFMSPELNLGASEVKVLFLDCVKRIQERYLKEESVHILSEGRVTPNAMERFLALQRDRQK